VPAEDVTFSFCCVVVDTAVDLVTRGFEALFLPSALLLPSSIITGCSFARLKIDECYFDII